MFSENEASSSPSDRILSKTLREVGSRRRRRSRQQSVAVVSLSVVILCAILWEGNVGKKEVGLESPPVPIIATTDAPVVRVQRIGAGVRRGSLIERSFHLGNLEKLAVTSPGPRLIMRVSDGELLASLPENQVAGLLKNPDGSSRLVFLRNSITTQ